MRQSSAAMVVSVSIGLAIVVNLVTNTVEIPPALAWLLLVSLGIAAILLENRGRLPVARTTQIDPADELAEAVGREWRAEEKRRQIHDPTPLPVRWRDCSHEPFSDNWPRNYPPSVGSLAETIALDGSLEDIVDVYLRVLSGRLVVLGKAGSGKTVLASRLVLGLLDLRDATNQTVPVIFNVATWNPAEDGPAYAFLGACDL